MQDQALSLKEANSAGEQEKASAIGRRSRFGSFGFGSQLLQKTVGLVLNRQGRQVISLGFLFDINMPSDS